MTTNRVAVIALLTALSSISTQAQTRPRSETILKLQKQPIRRVDTLVVHDTVTLMVVRVDTVRVPALTIFDTVFRRETVHDTVRDTLRRRSIVPIPIPVPIPLSRTHTVASAAECFPTVVTPPTPTTPTISSPEPASLILVATTLLAAIGIARVRRKTKRIDGAIAETPEQAADEARRANQ